MYDMYVVLCVSILSKYNFSISSLLILLIPYKINFVYGGAFILITSVMIICLYSGYSGLESSHGKSIRRA